MRSKPIFLAFCAGAAILVSGCSGDNVGPWSSPDARINAAFPLSETLRSNRTWLLEATTGEQPKETSQLGWSRV